MLLKEIRREYRRQRRRINRTRDKSKYEYYKTLEKERRLKEKEKQQELYTPKEGSQSSGCLSSIVWLFISICLIVFLFQSCGMSF